MLYWDVMLRDGTRFVGFRRWWRPFVETVGEREYEVVDSPTLAKGRVVSIGYGAMLYRVLLGSHCELL